MITRDRHGSAARRSSKHVSGSSEQGGPVSASADVTVEDHAQVPEPTTLTSLISGMISLAGMDGSAG